MLQQEKKSNRLKLILFLILAVSVFSLCGASQTKASGNVYGWAWTSNIGWISFNNMGLTSSNAPSDDAASTANAIPAGVNSSDANHGKSDYGLTINKDGTLTGYAWSSNIGWINFNIPPDFNAYPGCGYPSTPCYSAKVTLSGSYPVTGWARACSVFQTGCSGTLNSDRGGWNGWIQLYNISIDTSVTPAQFHYWVWGGRDDLSDIDNTKAVIGWGTFNCAEGGPAGQSVCGTSNYKVVTTFQFAQTTCTGANGNWQCTVNNCKGAPCATADDCNKSPLPLGCNDCQQCVPGGANGSCASDNDCKPTCNGTNGNWVCSPNSCGGIACTKTSDCTNSPLPLGCNDCQQCVPGGTQGSCTSDNDCKKTCNGPNGNWVCSQNSCGGTACTTIDDCTDLPLGCNKCKQCVPGGTQGSCASDADCSPKPTCNGTGGKWVCSVNACGGAYCTTAADCKVPPMTMGCNACQQCVPGGTGGTCSSDADCKPTCNGSNGNWQCTISSCGGAPCATTADCADSPLPTHCNGCQQCVPGGSGIACKSDADCPNPNQCQTCTKDNSGKILSCSANMTCKTDISGNLSCSTHCSSTCAGTNGNWQCTVSSCGGAPCATTADCADSPLPTHCNGCQQCVPGGSGIACTTDADCSSTCAGSNGNWQCTKNSCGGASCATAADCTDSNLPTKCNGCSQCVPGGTGADCKSDADCKNQPPQVIQVDPPIPNQPLTTPPLTAETFSMDPCSGNVYFGWTYIDASNNPETEYEFQLADNPDFSPTVIDYDTGSSLFYPSGKINNAPPVRISINPAPGQLSYNTAYYWRVKVYDNKGLDSGWQNAYPVNSKGQAKAPSFTTPLHHYPIPFFASSLQSPIIANGSDTASFADTSKCYDINNDEYTCNTLTSDTCNAAPNYNGKKDCYAWWFNFNNKKTPDAFSIGNASHNYTSAGNYLTKLQVCDDIGCCSVTSPVKINPPLNSPQWQEISPYQ